MGIWREFGGNEAWNLMDFLVWGSGKLCSNGKGGKSLIRTQKICGSRAFLRVAELSIASGFISFIFKLEKISPFFRVNLSFPRVFHTIFRLWNFLFVLGLEFFTDFQQFSNFSHEFKYFNEKSNRKFWKNQLNLKIRKKVSARLNNSMQSGKFFRFHLIFNSSISGFTRFSRCRFINQSLFMFHRKQDFPSFSYIKSCRKMTRWQSSV